MNYNPVLVDDYFKKIINSGIYAGHYISELKSAKAKADFARQLDRDAASGQGKTAAEQGLSHYHTDYENLVMARMQKDKDNELLAEIKKMNAHFEKMSGIRETEMKNSPMYNIQHAINQSLKELEDAEK